MPRRWKGAALNGAFALLQAALLAAYGLLGLFGLPALWSWLAWALAAGAGGLLFLRGRRAASLLLQSAALAAPLALSAAYGFVTYAGLHEALPLPEERGSDEGRPLLAHLSDTHFLAPGRGTTEEGDRWDPAWVRDSLGRLKALRPAFVVVTGDITDTGAEDEWEVALSSWLAPLGRTAPVVLAPGNHDMQPAMDVKRRKIFSQVHRQEQLAARYLRAQAELLPGIRDWQGRPLAPLARELWEGSKVREVDAWVLDCVQASVELSRGAGGRLSPAGAGAAFKSCQELGERRLREAGVRRPPRDRPEPDYRDWFPLVFLQQPERSAVLVLDSNVEPTWTIGRVGLGAFGSGQLDRLEKALSRLPRDIRRVFVILHHRPLKYMRDLWSPPRAFWSLDAWRRSPAGDYGLLSSRWEESNRLVEILLARAEAEPDREFHLLFGHYHAPRAARLQGLVGVREAPAAYRGGYWVASVPEDGERLRWRLEGAHGD